MADNARSGSAANRFRRARFAWFRALAARFPAPIEVLDVGGTVEFWEQMGVPDPAAMRVTLVNRYPQPSPYPSITAVKGDATDLAAFADGSFDIAFSNSVIEHVGDFEQQRRMASEMRRVGRAVFLQTPNFYFPVEPHFLVPFFQFFPLWLRVFLIRRADLGWYRRQVDAAAARRLALSARLLTRRRLRRLFPGAAIRRERFAGFTKSFVVIVAGAADGQ